MKTTSKRDVVTHQFVSGIPARSKMEAKTLYISIPLRIANHLCICGCGTETPTPLDPDEWSMTFNGESVTLEPSIGNQKMKCQSHYWIKCGQAIWIPDHPVRKTHDKIRKGIMAAFRRIISNIG